MSVLDPNIKKTRKTILDKVYWSNQTTTDSTLNIVDISGYNSLIIKISCVVADSNNNYLQIQGFRKSDDTNTNETLQFIDAKTKNPIPPNRGTNNFFKLKTGTFYLKTDISNFNKFYIHLITAAGEISSLAVSYVASEEMLSEHEISNIPTKTFIKHFENDKMKVLINTDVDRELMSLFRNIAVFSNLYSRNILYVSTDGLEGSLKSIAFNSTNFPNLISGSTIQHVITMPWTRNLTTEQHGKDWRMCVISDKGQIYHNFPSRSTTTDGTALTGDEYLFDESVVWDLPTKKFPSKTNTSSIYLKNPSLPDAAYVMYPPVLTSNGFGNNGFGESITKTKSTGDSVTCPRYYIHNRTQNPLKYMGGMEYDSKLCLLGTYANNINGDAFRITTFATSDGGRQWFAKYDFGDTLNADLSVQDIRGNTVNTSAIATEYTGGFSAYKRTQNTPTNSVKEPTTPFSIGSAVSIPAGTIIKGASTRIDLGSGVHGFVSGDVIFFKRTSGSADANWDWMLNETADAGTFDSNGNANSGYGSGLFFKVVKIDNNGFYLYEMVHNAANNIGCRHIHHINRCKDGFTVGCGEAYPNGWMFFVPQHNTDSFAIINAWDDMPFIRLNSSATGLQRPLGFIVKDDSDRTILFGSDNEHTPLTPTTFAGRTTTLPKNSAGIFKGRLTDIDDMNLFKSILEIPQVAFYFKEKLGALIVVGQSGYFAISFDDGISWLKLDLPTSMYGNSRWLGNSFNREIGIQGMVIKLK